MSGFDLVIRPDEDEPGAAEALVDATIGERPYRFLLDTGAGTSRVVADEYTASLPTVESRHSSGIFAGDRRDVVVLPTIRLGPIVRSDVAVTRIPDGGPGQPNLIGMDVLRGARLQFLFDESRVVVDPDEADVPRAGLRDLVVDALHHPYVELEFGPVRARAVWDTGAGLTVVDAGFVDLHPELFEAAGRSTGTDSSGGSMETPMLVMAPSRIGGRPFGPQRVAAVDLGPINATLEIPMDLILGYNVMRTANWWMDFPGGRWAVAELEGTA